MFGRPLPGFIDRPPILPPVLPPLPGGPLTLPMPGAGPLIPPLLPRLPGVPSSPGPGVGLPGGYWVPLNQHPGGVPGPTWPDDQVFDMKKAGRLTWTIEKSQAAYPAGRCNTNDKWTEKAWVQRQTVSLNGVTKFAIKNHTLEIEYVCSGTNSKVRGTGGLKAWGVINGVEQVIRDYNTVGLHEVYVGSTYGVAKVVTRYVSLLFDGDVLVPPSKIPEWFPGWGLPDRKTPAPEPLPSPPVPLPSPAPVPAPLPKPGDPPLPEILPKPDDPTLPARPVAPPVPAPPLPVTPAPQPPVRPAAPPAPGAPVLPGQSPGSGGAPEVGPIAPPVAVPLPPAPRPDWEEDFGDTVIGHPSERPAPTLEGLAEITGKIEQKLRVIHERQRDDLPPVSGQDYARLVWEILTSAYPPGSFLLVPPCDRLPDGTMAPPVEIPWPEGVGPLAELSEKIDALASLLQAHKDQGQPVCVRQREGRKVTVILREVE